MGNNRPKWTEGWSAHSLLYFPLSNSAACSSAVRKPAISLADSTDLRVLLNIMYLMVETVQQDDPTDKPEWKLIRETFRAELGRFVSAPVLWIYPEYLVFMLFLFPLSNLGSPLFNNEPISVMLFSMVTKFCSGHAPHFPMKKVLLLLWKSILVSWHFSMLSL